MIPFDRHTVSRSNEPINPATPCIRSNSTSCCGVPDGMGSREREDGRMGVSVKQRRALSSVGQVSDSFLRSVDTVYDTRPSLSSSYLSLYEHPSSSSFPFYLCHLQSRRTRVNDVHESLYHQGPSGSKHNFIRRGILTSSTTQRQDRNSYTVAGGWGQIKQ